MKNYKFFLGGNDLEMVEIRKVLAAHGVAVCDKNLSWGASVDAYQEEIKAALAAGETPVTVELLLGDKVEGVIDIDHHNENSGRPASILQVLDLLGEKPNRWQLLVAANDSSFIPGMIDLGATAEEIQLVRSADRQAQGITPEQEKAALTAIANKEVIGSLTVIRLEHSKCATVTDRLYGEYKNLLIVSDDGEINMFAASPEKIDEFVKSGMSAWNGAGFAGSYAPAEEVLNWAKGNLV